MIVDNIEWLSEEAQEAIVQVTDGEFECRAFCHPCSYVVGDAVSILYAIEPLGVMLSINEKTRLNSHSNDLGVDGTGAVNDIERGIVTVGKLLISLGGAIPKDVSVGELVDFSCERIDLWQHKCPTRLVLFRDSPHLAPTPLPQPGLFFRSLTQPDHPHPPRDRGWRLTRLTTRISMMFHFEIVCAPKAWFAEAS